MATQTVAFGKSKAELGAMLDSVSSRADINHSDKHDSLEYLEAGMKKLSKSSGAKETFGVTF